MSLSKEEEYVREELASIYEQLVINCKNVCGYGFNKHGGDLLALSCEFFLTKPLEQQLKTIKDGKLVNFVTYIMNLQMKSSTSRYYHKYRKHTEKSREYFTDHFEYASTSTAVSDTTNKAFEDEETEIFTCMQKVIDESNVYDQMLIKELILNGRKYKEVADQYNINYASLSRDLKNIKDKIKEVCQKYR